MPVDGGWLVNGVKTWATFAGRADVLMLLARTDADRSKGHRGLSVLIVEKPRAEGHAFQFEDGRGGKMEGRAIDTIGYRGMHSYEVAFEDWFVPAENLIGEEAGLGRGFYLQMAGFENGRLQTAARAVGLMQAAFEAGLSYAQERKVFGQPVFDYQLSRVKLARMAALIQGGRQFSYDVSRKMAAGEGTLEASMVKAYVCRAAEWVTREAMQLHGGMGYAEEFPVSRYFVDARVPLDLRRRRRDAVPARHRPAPRRASAQLSRANTGSAAPVPSNRRAACAARSGTKGASSSTIARVATASGATAPARVVTRQRPRFARLDRAVDRVDLGNDRTGRRSEVEARRSPRRPRRDSDEVRDRTPVSRSCPGTAEADDALDEVADAVREVAVRGLDEARLR